MNKQDALETSGKIADAVEDKLDVILPETVEAVNIVKNNPYLLAGVAVVSLAAGGALGYYAAKKRLQPKYEAIIKQEIEETKEYYSRLYKVDDYETPAAAVERLIPKAEQEAIEAHRAYRGEKVIGQIIGVKEDEAGLEVEVQLNEGVEVSNIFVNNQPLNAEDWDYDTEKEQRSEDFPYVIHQDEYFENDAQYEQVTMTYYEGDDILADEADQPITDVEGNVGEKNLQKFGHGSGDQNTVYIRNNKRGLDFEVVRSRGKFAEEVAGFIEHSDKSSHIRRFRGDDE